MRAGFGGSYQYLAVALLTFLFIGIAIVFASGINQVYLISPANATWSNQDNETILFEFNYTGDNETALCALNILNSSLQWVRAAENDTTMRNTSTILQSNASIEEGTRLWFINCTNGSMSVTPPSYFTLRIDRTMPGIQIISPANSTLNSDVFNFTFNDTNLNCAWYSVDEGTNITNCSISEYEGVFGFQVWRGGNFSSLSDGPHNVTVWANDSAGNVNSTIVYFTIDKTKPIINVQSPMNQTYNVSSIWFNLTADEQLSSCSVEYGPYNWYKTFYTMANTSGNWNYYNNSLFDAVWDVRFHCNDTAGNQNEWNLTALNFTIDTTPPAIYISQPLNASMRNDSFYFTYSEVNCSWYSLDGAANVTNCTIRYNYWSGSFIGLTDGPHSISIWVNDSAGNENSTVTYWTRDTAKPTITIQSPLNQTYNASSIWFNVTVSENADTCVVENLNAYYQGNRTLTNSSGRWSYNNGSMADNTYYCVFVCNDTAGNINSTGAVYYTVHAISPNISIYNPVNATINSDSFYFGFGENVNCSWRSIDNYFNETNCTLENFWFGNFAGLSDGPHSVVVWANDSVGNTNSSTRYWTRDTAIPPIFIHSPQNITYNTSTIALNVSSDGTEQGWKYNLNGAGNQTFWPNSTITVQYGSNTLVVYVNDSAGNKNSSSVSFYVNGTYPKVEAAWHASSGDGGWGETHTFYVNCSDPDGQNVSLNLLYRKSASDSWALVGNQTCSGVSPQTYSFSINFACSNVTLSGQNSSFMFNATDSGGLDNQTAPQNFTLDKDDVAFTPEGPYDSGSNFGERWRNETIPFDIVVLVGDSDKSVSIGSGNATAWVTKNASDPASWDVGKYLQVNSTGHVHYEFLNDSEMPMHECNYSTGIHQIKFGIGGINESSCYKTSNSTAYNLSIGGDLRPRINAPTGTHGFIVGDQINISGYVDDDCSDRTGEKVEGVRLDQSSPPQRYILKTGITTRYCIVSSEGGGWYNCSWDSTGQNRAKWNITMTVEKGYHGSNSAVEADAFHLGTAPEVYNPSVSPSPGAWGQTFAFSVYFGDADSDVNNLSLWLSTDNATWHIYNSTSISSSGTYRTFYQHFSCSDVGRLYYKFNATDPYNYTAETSPETLNITGNGVVLSINSSENSHNVSILNDTAALVFGIYDSVNGSYPSGAGGLVWITENGHDYTKALNCTTTAGQCQVSYNPNASTSVVGTQYWKAGTNDTCYEQANSTNKSILVTSPVSEVSISPHAVINGSVVKFFSSYSNASIWLWANVTLPDSNHRLVYLANGTNTSFTANQTGRYDVTFIANDSLHEVLSAGTDYFESFQPLLFNASVVSQNSSGVNSTFVFYYRDESLVANDSSNGSFSGQIVKSVLDMEVRCYGDRLGILLRDVNASSDNNRTLGVDRHSQTSGYLLTYGINNTYNITSAMLTIHYDDIAYSDEGNLQLHKCNNYNFSSRTCLGSWSDVTANATQNTTGHYFLLNVTSFSGFAIMQYVVASSPPSGYSTASQPSASCTMNWSCGAWGPCQPGGTETRTCADKGSCRTANRTESRSCAYVIPATCSDNLLNGGESDVDCGNRCQSCANGKACRDGHDCQSNFCENGTCKTPSSSGERPESSAAGKQERPWIFDTGMLLLSVLLTAIIILVVLSLAELLALEKKKVRGEDET